MRATESRGGGNGGGGERNGKKCGRARKLFFFSVQTFFSSFLLKNIPQVQYLLWSTKLPNVLISTANAAGEQEDGL